MRKVSIKVKQEINTQTTVLRINRIIETDDSAGGTNTNMTTEPEPSDITSQNLKSELLEAEFIENTRVQMKTAQNCKSMTNISVTL